MRRSLREDIKAFSFYSFAVNTEKLNGVCGLLDSTFNYNNFYLPSRHHIHEIMLVMIFSTYIGPYLFLDLYCSKLIQAILADCESR